MGSTRKNTITCAPGMVMRKGYTRKFRQSITKSGFTVRRKGKMYTVRPKVSDVYVPPSCVKDRGEKGKGPQIFGKLRKGDLIKYGYQYRLSDRLRHKALEKAEVAYGALTLFHKLDAVSKLSKRTVPDASKIFSQDRDWVSEHYLHKK
jgi:hypothetical protein